MIFTQDDIFAIAMAQSALDQGCRPEDYSRTENVIVTSVSNPAARKYLKLPLDCGLVSYGSNIVASVSEPCRDIVSRYLESYAVAHCFETPNLHMLDDELQKQNLRICFMAEYFLPELEALKPTPCPMEIRLLAPEGFADLYTPDWSNALCKDRRELDVIGMGAYDNGKLIALAGASADCDTMWQIGIDVLPAYRRRGIASALTSRLALAILERGKVPFYCAAWSNIPSVRNAIRSGFRPAWVEITAKPSDFVNRMNSPHPSLPLQDAIFAEKNDEKAAVLARFFKSGPGQYGEGDRFLGVTVPKIRAIVKRLSSTLRLEDLEPSIQSPFHEVRLGTLLSLVQLFKCNKGNHLFQKQCIDFYLSHTEFINNWDLVDLSCYDLLGSWLLDKDRTILYLLAQNGKTL